jgi:HPt (histidine-containing phosphotransfer) domain-containing protein
VFPPIPLFLAFLQNEIVHSIDSSIVLDRDQLRDITMDDDELMHEILATLLDDTSAQIHKLASAVTDADASLCMRLAHYCKGSCGNVGANATAAVFRDIERYAKGAGISTVQRFARGACVGNGTSAGGGYRSVRIAETKALTASAHNTAACFDSAGSPPPASSTIAGLNAAIWAGLLPVSHSVSADPAAMEAVHPRTL